MDCVCEHVFQRAVEDPNDTPLFGDAHVVTLLTPTLRMPHTARKGTERLLL